MNNFNIPDEAFDELDDTEKVKRSIEEGKTFQDIVGYPDEVMEKFYQAARKMFEKQNYEDAVEAFTFLSTLNPYIHAYWLGLGMSQQLLGDYEAALTAYSMAKLTDPENPIAFYHSANCLYQQGKKKEAIEDLKMAVLAAGDNEDDREIKKRAQKLIENYNNCL